MRLLASALALPLVVIAPRRADACSCAHQPPSIAPADAATGVPLNVRVIVHYEWILDASIELRDATTGEVVPTTQEMLPPRGPPYLSVVSLTPTAALAPATTYTVVVPTPGLSSVTSSFTTGDSVDMTPPAFTGITALMVETMDWPVANEDGSTCVSSCIEIADGHISRIRFDYADPPSDAVYVAMQLYRPGETVTHELPVAASQRSFGYDSCSTRSPVLVPGGDYCARVVAYDIAGNVAGAGSEVCATARTCESRGVVHEPLGLPCEPSDECVPVSEEPAAVGCSSSRAPAWLVALAALACVRRKRKGPERRSTLGPGFRDHPGR